MFYQVSDIDDTIKLSFVTDKPLFIKNTLLREFQAVPGMAELYKVHLEIFCTSSQMIIRFGRRNLGLGSILCQEAPGSSGNPSARFSIGKDFRWVVYI